MTAPTYQQIAMRSYLIWEEEGRPHGQDIDHWLQAEAELKALFNPPARSPLGPVGNKVKPGTSSRAKASTRKRPTTKKKSRSTNQALQKH